eukprot:scaffold38725_cov52-Attheya_sp.AAC.1
MEFYHDTVLVTGSNFGDVCVWDLNISRDSGFSDSMSRLTIRHRTNSAHNGTVEAVEVCGNIALTSGGNDGAIKGWDLSKGTLLGIVSCHPGRALPDVRDQTMLKSSVVGSLFHNESIVSICRDGTLHTWDYNSVCYNSKSVVKPTEWNCDRCTLLNYPKEAKCCICGAVRKKIACGFELKDPSLPDLEMDPHRKRVFDNQIDLSAKRITLNQHHSQVHWNKMFQCLKQYKAETGHTIVTKEAGQLYSWVLNQRQFYRKWNSCGTCEDPNISPPWKEKLRGRIVKLNSIGFVWESREKQWNDMFLQLVAYKKSNGHTNVPLGESKLGEWVRSQRRRFLEQRKKDSCNRLEKKRVDALNKIGFVWEALEMKWNNMFLQLLEYKKLNGHTNVPRRESKLGSWVITQRRSFNDLSQERTDALNKVGFQLDPRKRPHQSLSNIRVQPPRKRANKRSCPVPTEYPTPAVEQMGNTVIDEHENPHTKLTSSQIHWNRMFECLKQYQAETGHTIVTNEARQLYSWVANQRFLYQKWNSCGTCDQNISPAWKEQLNGRIVKLNSIGFVWEAREKQWNDMFLQLVAFKKANGHTNVPTRESELGEWVRSQRRRFLEHRKKGRCNRLEKKRVDALNKIGFVWEALEMKWNDMFLQLLEYKKLNGHTNVPESESKLGAWVITQRRSFNDLSQERIDSLNKVGFQLNPRKRPHQSLYNMRWNDMFLQLVAYKKVNGHTNVPIRENELGEWVRSQRRRFLEHRKKGSCNRLEKKRVDALNKIGFVWEVLEMKWNDMFLQLLEYKKLNGHTNVPKRESKLGAWVINQRIRFNDLSQERTDALNKVGFQWNLLKRTSKGQGIVPITP